MRLAKNEFIPKKKKSQLYLTVQKVLVLQATVFN